MKKVVALLLALLMLPLISAGAESADVICVYAQLPQTWTYPCAWAWNAEGENAFAAWPGDMMIPDDKNPGWYYIYVPAGMESVIINANDGAVQTAEVRIDQQNAWITVGKDAAAEVSAQQKTEGELPAYAERYTVWAKVDPAWENPCIWAWADPDGINAFASWPGYAMKANANGWYCAMVPAWCNSVIINAGGGSVQTADIKDLDPADLWITVGEDAGFDVTYEDPNAPKAEDITVYARVPADWEAPCLWAWSHPEGVNAFSAWPGEALIPGEDGWYSLTAPGWINSVIINANGGTVQTADQRVETEKDLYITITGAEDVVVSYEKPAE